MNKRINFFNLDIKEYKEIDNKIINKTKEILEKDKLIIINWLKSSWKTNFIKNFINTTNNQNSYFYFNKDEDLTNDIKNEKSLFFLINEYIKLYKKPEIIILKNFSKIDWIKNFITEIYKKWYKIILIWNDIQISWIKEIEIRNQIIINNNIDEKIKYWSSKIIEEISDSKNKEIVLNNYRSDILLNDIFKIYSIKNIYLYNYTITYLSKINIYLSLRDIAKNINNIENISLKTTIDYIEFSLKAKIIKRVYNFDQKTKKEINSKAKYYFSDNWIRNSFALFKLSNDILIENFVFNILEYNNYEIFWGLNWKFNFSFYCKKDNNEIFIHISKQETKEELKKEVNKLNKIWWEWKKFLIVKNIWELWIKKIVYDKVEIIEIYDFFKKIK